MRRRAVIAAFAAASVAALTAGLSAQAASPATPDAKLASVKLLSCSQSTHSAVYRGRMTRVAGSDHMALRYTLLSKQPAANAETRVRVPGLGRWHSSKSGVGTFSFKQEMLNLAPGGSYRVRVDYRWLDETGAVVKSTRRRSVSCSQLDRLPNLRVQIVDGGPTATDGVWRYTLRVGNVGLGQASNVGVRLSVDGAVVDDELLPLLAAGSWSRVSVHGPACQRWAEAVVDPDGTVMESSDVDNAHRLACADLLAG